MKVHPITGRAYAIQRHDTMQWWSGAEWTDESKRRVYIRQSTATKRAQALDRSFPDRQVPVLVECIAGGTI